MGREDVSKLSPQGSLTVDESRWLGELYELHYAALWQACRRRARAQQWAEDALQETWFLAAVKFRELRASQDPEGWLHTVAWRVVSHHWRSRRRFASLEQELGQNLRAEPFAAAGDTILGEVLHTLAGERLRGALQQLRRPDREVVDLYYQGYSWTEVAMKLGRSEDAVKSQFQRAKAHLKKALGSNDLGGA